MSKTPAAKKPNMGEFSDAVFQQVARIPRGKVATYGQIARLIGSPRSARYIGYALRSNPSPGMAETDIPCHRVTFKDGSLCKSFVFGGPGEQREMLELEGVTFLDDGRVNLDECLWDPNASCGADTSAGFDFPTAPPLDFNWKLELGE